MPEITCVRCGMTGPAIEKVPFRDATGDEVKEKICQNCWQEWLKMQIMVINEFRLNPTDPQSMDILKQHMREFLGLESGGDVEFEKRPDPR